MHDDPEVHLHDPVSGGLLPGLTTEDIEGIEVFTLRSVGIDIGSSTSHVVFSRLTLRREGAALSAHFVVTDRQILYQSPIMLTPYLQGTLIDAEQLREFIQAAYRGAGVTPEEIDTGAVVLTGEALTKENARSILELFAHEAGKFICASAGPNHEALLAAHGSGAVALSRETGTSVLNVDVGGGTTKLSLIRDGVVAQTAAVNVGARLVAFDDRDVIVRIEEPARLLLKELGYSLDIGDRLLAEHKSALVEMLTDLLFEAIEAAPATELGSAFQVTPPLAGYRGLGEIGHVVVSGGVSEYVFGHEDGAFGDLGPLLGASIRRRFDDVGRPDLLREPVAGIRATVIGAGEYTVQASGNTSYISDEAALPAFGLKVVRPHLTDLDGLQDAFFQALEKYDLVRYSSGLALAISITEPPTYASLRKLAEGIAAVVSTTDTPEAPIFLVLDMDVAKSLGGILKEELRVPQDLIVIDGIDVGDLDYVDIGRPMGVSEVLPVTVKSLMFPTRRQDSPKQYWHSV
jgi:ethanolamine utilization protein EutA